MVGRLRVLLDMYARVLRAKLSSGVVRAIVVRRTIVELGWLLEFRFAVVE